jgi:hypothetical protein
MDSIQSPSQFQGGGGDCRPGRRDALQDGAKGEDPHQGLAAERRRRRGGSGGYLARSSQQHREQGRRGGRGEQQYCFQHAPLLHVDSRFSTSAAKTHSFQAHRFRLVRRKRNRMCMSLFCAMTMYWSCLQIQRLKY